MFLCMRGCLRAVLTLLLTHLKKFSMANVALARVYQQSFESHPYTTLAFTNGALNALGDAVAQLTQRFVRARFATELDYVVTSCRSSRRRTTVGTSRGMTSLGPCASLRLDLEWVSDPRTKFGHSVFRPGQAQSSVAGTSSLNTTSPCAQ